MSGSQKSFVSTQREFSDNFCLFFFSLLIFAPQYVVEERERAGRSRTHVSLAEGYVTQVRG